MWEGLERCWEEFESLRRGGGTGGGSGGGVGGLGGKEDVERFVGGWQIFIFECCALLFFVFIVLLDMLTMSFLKLTNR